jgi:hypothetical protein
VLERLQANHIFVNQIFGYSFEKLQGKLELKSTSASAAEAGPRAELGPNLDRLTVGVESDVVLLGNHGHSHALSGCTPSLHGPRCSLILFRFPYRRDDAPSASLSGPGALTPTGQKQAVPTGGVGDFVVCALLQPLSAEPFLFLSGGTNLLGQI